MINNILAVHILTATSFQDIDRGGVLNAGKAMQNFCGVLYRHNKETYLHPGIFITSSVVQKSRSELFDSGTFLGTSDVNVKNCGLDECIEVEEGLVVADTEGEVCFEELIESCQGCLCLAGDGLVVNDDVVSLDAVPLLTHTQEEGLSRHHTSKERFDTGSHL